MVHRYPVLQHLAQISPHTHNLQHAGLYSLLSAVAIGSGYEQPLARWLLTFGGGGYLPNQA